MPVEGNAQPLFPKYVITGLIELDYSDYSTTITSSGKKTESDASTFQERVKLGVQGYIKTPKLAVYEANVTFRHAATTFGSTGAEDTHLKERQIDYDLFMNFLKFRPYSLEVYATRSSGTFTDGGSLDTTTNTYGLTLKVSLKDILKPKGRNGGGDLSGNLPLLMFQYNHFDHDLKGSGTNSADSFSSFNSYNLELRGNVNSIRTRYVLGYEIIDSSTTVRSVETQTARANTYTSLKGNNFLSTSLLYSSGDNNKVTVATADLSLNPTERFSHEYAYSYFSNESNSSRSDSHDLSGAWGYRFSRELRGRATAFYALINQDEESENTYGSTAFLTYSTPIKDFNFDAGYSVAYKYGTQLGEFVGHAVELGLQTRKLKWGTIYADYNFNYDTMSNEGSLMEHVVRMGVHGRGPGRAYWTVEGRYVNATNDLGASAIELQPETRAGTSNYYSLIAEGGYPLGRRGGIYLQSSYSSGTANGADLKTFYYEARLNYSILRNLSLVAWWRTGMGKDCEFI